MIKPSAVKAFLKRELDDFSWVKDLTHKELNEALEGLVPARTIKRSRLHQKACLLIGISYPAFCFWLDMGTGKTLLTLELLRFWIGEGERIVVCAPTKLVVDGWEEQILKWDIDLPYTLINQVSTEDKWDALENAPPGLVIIAYSSIVLMVCDRVAHKKKKDKEQLKIAKKKLARFCSFFSGMVLDESTKVANHQSLAFKALDKLADTARVRYALAGRPFGRDPTPLWAQHMLIDRGESLGETLGMFRAAYFIETRGYWTRFEYRLDPKKEEKLHSAMANRSIEYSADECIDLPQVMRIVKHVRFPGDTEAYYRSVVKELIASKANITVMKHVFLRMRQISSGFVGFKNDDTGERASVEFPDNPKLDQLMELTFDMPQGAKMVVFHEFTYSGRKISEELKKAKIGHEWIWGGNKDPKKSKKRFLTDAKCEVLVLNTRMGAYGTDGLQDVANYLAFYESPVSVIDREQAERRLIRDGQKQKVFLYDLVVKGSMDERILTFHREGDDLLKTLFRRPEVAAYDLD